MVSRGVVFLPVRRLRAAAARLQRPHAGCRADAKLNTASSPLLARASPPSFNPIARAYSYSHTAHSSIMSTVRRTYGKKAKPVLTPLFFDSSPQTPEIRRSPRLRKVLEEKSHNVQTLSEVPHLSPCKTRATESATKIEVRIPAKKVEAEVLVVLDSEEESEEMVEQPSQPLDEELAEALDTLAISTPENRPFESFKAPSIPRSVTRRPASSSFSARKLPKLLKQHSIALDADTALYIEPLVSCKNVSKSVESFSDWIEERSALLSFTKIGEGSYGQVFRATDARGETVIIKLMPLNSQKGKRWQSFTTIDSAATEVQLLEKMQKVPGYVEFRGACVLQGNMPEAFVKMWEEYTESGRTVESRDPRIKGSYPVSQLWLMLELSDAGTNLEPGRYLPSGVVKVPKNGKYLPVVRVWDIFWQVTHAVAKAEVYCEFEHRDLHLGNICVKDRPEKELETQNSKTPSQLPFAIDTSGILVTIIDYTLSRAKMSDNETLAFNFQADEDLLSGEGDLQYDIYRWMDEVLGDRGCKTYDPRTNVLWLHHLMEKLLAVTTAIPRGKASQTAQQMRKILKETQKMIDPEYMGDWVANSAGDLLQCAYAKEWIAGDVA